MAKQLTPEELEKKKKADKIKFRISLTVSLLAVAGAGGYVYHNASQKRERFVGVDTSRFSKTIFNVPQTLPIENGKVKINIKNVFSETQLEKIKKGIEELDNVAEGINYEVHFDEDNIKKCITIDTYSKKDYTSRQSKYAAYQIHKLDQFKAEIQYPITIKLNPVYSTDDYNIDTVVKHELLHTLGFKDLTDYDYKGCLMFYANVGNDITKKEKNFLNTVYASKYTNLVETELPTKLECLPVTSDDKQLEF